MATERAHWRFTVDEYHHMLEAGILSEDDRVELLDGEIVEMSPIGGRHVACVNEINRILVEQLGSAAIVSVQNPIRLGQYQEPQPDVAVIRRRTYGDELPRPEDVLLLVEVSDSSLSFDRRTKLPMYAAAGIPEVWLVDIQSGAIERHTDPTGGAYRVSLRVGRGGTIESTVLPEFQLATDNVLSR